MSAALVLWILAFAAAAANDPALVARAFDRGGRHLRALVTRLMPVVKARVYRRMGSWSAAAREDAVQEVWVGLLADRGKAVRGFEPGPGRTLEGFVGMLAERAIIDWIRRQQAAKRGGGAVHTDERALLTRADASAGPENHVLTADLAEALGRHIRETLPEIGRLVFRLVYTDRLGPAEAATTLGVNRQVVYNWQHRIRREVRLFLAEAN